MKIIKKVFLLVLIASFVILTGCSNSKEEKLLGIDYNTDKNEVELSNYKTENPVVALYIKNYGSVVIELYPDIAPNTVNNFISLVKEGYYDNNTFHRLVPGFVLQGGDPTGTGTGGPGYTIKGEFSSNGFENKLKHEKGIVSMARSQDNDSAGSQFFIMLDKADYLDGEYAAFGKVIDGMDIVEQIEKSETVLDESTGQLLNNLSLKKALVDLKGKSYSDVEKIS
ncbi:MAG: peptidylprolyl isomerase [Firmicutes bacterium]|nr:peptidylprolyl isomerase [Bacillota bacterium]